MFDKLKLAMKADIPFTSFVHAATCTIAFTKGQRSNSQMLGGARLISRRNFWYKFFASGLPEFNFYSTPLPNILDYMQRYAHTQNKNTYNNVYYTCIHVHV